MASANVEMYQKLLDRHRREFEDVQAKGDFRVTITMCRHRREQDEFWDRQSDRHSIPTSKSKADPEFTTTETTFQASMNFSPSNPSFREISVKKGTEVISLLSDDDDDEPIALSQENSSFMTKFSCGSYFKAMDVDNPPANQTLEAKPLSILRATSSVATSTVVPQKRSINPNTNKGVGRSNHSTDIAAKSSPPAHRSQQLLTRIMTSREPNMLGTGFAVQPKTTEENPGFPSSPSTTDQPRANRIYTSAKAGNKRRKTIDLDCCTQIPHNVFREHVFDHSAILRRPPKLSRHGLQQQKNEAAFVKDILHDRKTNNYTPGLGMIFGTQNRHSETGNTQGGHIQSLTVVLKYRVKAPPQTPRQKLSNFDFFNKPPSPGGTTHQSNQHQQDRLVASQASSTALDTASNWSPSSSMSSSPRNRTVRVFNLSDDSGNESYSPDKPKAKPLPVRFLKKTKPSQPSLPQTPQSLPTPHSTTPCPTSASKTSFNTHLTSAVVSRLDPSSPSTTVTSARPQLRARRGILPAETITGEYSRDASLNNSQTWVRTSTPRTGRMARVRRQSQLDVGSMEANKNYTTRTTNPSTSTHARQGYMFDQFKGLHPRVKRPHIGPVYEYTDADDEPVLSRFEIVKGVIIDRDYVAIKSDREYREFVNGDEEMEGV
ncbi:hypothetical protein B0J11DRAFT_593393 [Dendryphion nanum]|uniref:Uncharacterized protein n=1 Tax=Dendryphion nanum TaxID=256645 RepID=A0A9P9DBJ2_9PLEO|nr:hypothetical protein B0J11DRAFT_593393 [Dendryphion nanum]